MSEGIHIMIVDDHPVFVDGLKTMLTGINGFSLVATASNGRDALKYLQYKKTDIVLMDVDMPLMDGAEATKKIKISYPHVKVLVLSSYSEQAVIKKMLEAGAFGYVLKTTGKEEIIAAIRKVMQGERVFSKEIESILNKKETSEVIKRLNLQQGAELLTSREINVLGLIAKGFTNKEISSKLYISSKTVDNHRTHIMSKLNVHNVAGLIRFAIQNKIVE